MRGGMTSVCLLVIFALSSCSANYGSYYGGNAYGSNSYGSNSYAPSRYNHYSRPSTSYYAPKTSEVPICSKVKTVLRVLVVEQKDGKCVNGAHVSYVDSKTCGDKTTNSKGYVNLVITGCRVGLIVYRKNGEPVHRDVDLTSCTSKYEKVVITMKDACDFDLKLAHEGIGPGDGAGAGGNSDCMKCGDEDQLVSLIYKSGEHTGTTQAVAEVVCITAGNSGEKLKVIATSQYGNTFNVLDVTVMTNTFDSRFAVMALPYRLDPNSKYDLVFTSNTFEDDMMILNTISAWGIINEDGMTTLGTGTGDKFSGSIAEMALMNDKWLLWIQYHTSPDDSTTDVDLEGNVVVVDCNGNYRTVEHPDNGDDYNEGDYFLVGCFCANAPSLAVESNFKTIGTVLSMADGPPNYAMDCTCP